MLRKPIETREPNPQVKPAPIPTALECAAQALDLPRVLFNIIESYVGFQGVLHFSSAFMKETTKHERRLKTQLEREQVRLIWDEMGWSSLQDVWNWFQSCHFTQQTNLLPTLVALRDGRSSAFVSQIDFSRGFLTLASFPSDQCAGHLHFDVGDEPTPITMLCILPQGLLASDSWENDEGPRIWNPATGDVIQLDRFRKPMCMAAVENGFAWGTIFGEVFVHEVWVHRAGSMQSVQKHVLSNHWDSWPTRHWDAWPTRAMVALQENKLVVHYTKFVCVWDVLHGICLITFDVCFSPSMVVLPDQRIAAVENVAIGKGQFLRTANANTGEYELCFALSDNLVIPFAASVFFLCGKLFVFINGALVAVLK
jgi:hypothetical protein